MKNELKELNQRILDLEKMLKEVKESADKIELTLLENERKEAKNKQAALMKSKTDNEEIKAAITSDRPKTDYDGLFQVSESKTRPLTSEDVQTSKFRQPIELNLSKWFSWVFMFILALGVLWMLKVGIDIGLITPLMRIILGYAIASVLLLLGSSYVKGGHLAFGTTLIGGFMAVGIFTSYASHHFYLLLASQVAFTLSLLIVAAGFFYAFKLKSETIAIFASVSGYLLPFLIGGEGAALSFIIYLLVLYLATFALASRLNKRVTFYLSFALLHLALVTYYSFGLVIGEQRLLVAAAFIQHLTVLFYYIRGQSRLGFNELFAYVNAGVLLWWILILFPPQTTLIYGFLILLYGILGFQVMRQKRRQLFEILVTISLFASFMFIHSFVYSIESIQWILLLLFGAGAIYLAVRYQSLKMVIAGSFIYLYATVNVFAQPFQSLISVENIVWLTLLFTLVIALYYLRKFALFKAVYPYLFGASQLILLYYLLKISALVSEQLDLNYYIGLHLSLLVSLIFFLSFERLGQSLGLKYISYIGRGVFSISLLTILFSSHPLYMYPFTLSYVIGLIVQAIYLSLLAYYLISYLKGSHLPYKAYYLGLAQVFYLIMLNKWYFFTVDLIRWESDAVLMGQTALILIYGFVSSYFARRASTTVFYIGLALIVLALIKLFVFDLVNVSVFIRSIMFILIGIIGLVYSRLLLKKPTE